MRACSIIAALSAFAAGCAGHYVPVQPGSYYIPQTQPVPFYPMRTTPAPQVQMPQYEQSIPQGYTANWTGKAVPGISVSGLSIMQCEYMYAGRTFVRNFQGSCPTTIQVQ